MAIDFAAAGDNKVPFDVEDLIRTAREDVQNVLFRTHRVEVWSELASATARLGMQESADEDFAGAYWLAISLPTPKEVDEALVEICRYQAERQDYAAAVRTLEQIVRAECRKDAIGRLIQTGYEAKNYAVLVDLIERFSESADKRDLSLAGLVSDISYRGKFNLAIEISKRIKSPSHLASSRCAIGREAADEGKISLALEMAEGNADPDLPILWMNVCVARAKAGNLAEARRDLQRAKSLFSRPENLIRSSFHYAALVAVGDVDEAIQMARKTKQEYELHNLIEVMAKLGKFSRAIELSREIRDPEHRAHALIEIAFGQKRAGDATGARNTLAEFQAIPNYPKSYVVQMAAAHHAVGDHARAALRVRDALEIVLAKSRDDDGQRIATKLCEVAEVQAELKFTVGAANTFRLARDEALKSPPGSSLDLDVQAVARSHTSTLGPEEIAEWVAKLEDAEVRAYGRIGILQGLLDRRNKK